MNKFYLVGAILLLALAIYLNAWRLPGFEGQRNEYKKYHRLYNK